MIGDGTVGSRGDVNRGDPGGGRERPGSQRPRSSVEAGQRPRSEGGQGGGGVKSTPGQKTVEPPGVPETAKQGGEARTLDWDWVEAEVWTERMLTALVKGVKGGKWYSLIDKIHSPRALKAAWTKVRKRRRAAAGVDGQSVSRFESRADRELERLHQLLKDDRYEPQPILRRWIAKEGGKRRPLGLPTVRDKVVQTAVRNALEPIFEAEFHDQSYGFRPGRGCKDALRRVSELLGQGHHWVVDADIESYFDRIDHGILLDEVGKRVGDGRVLKLLGSYLEQDVLDGLKRWTPEEGTPQGAVISPLLANVYLHPVDEALSGAGFQIVRYADDLVILCRSRSGAEAALELLGRETEARKLRLHPEKTKVVDAAGPGGFDFLGYHFERGRKWPRKRSVKKLRDRLRPRLKRTSGESLRSVVEGINPTLRGWFEYFKHSRRWVHAQLDGWVRMRLRSILRSRRGGRGRGRGRDHQRWPNAYFAELGLFSLAAAHAAVCQSLRGNH